MTNINDLDLVSDDRPVDDQYEPPSEFRTIPLEPGRYFLETVEVDWQATAEKLLMANFSIKERETEKTFRTRASAKGFFRGGGRMSKEERRAKPPNTSAIYDWLRANGYRESFSQLSKQPAELAATVEAFLNRQFEAVLDVRAFCPQCRQTIYEYARQFPTKADGVRDDSPLCPTCEVECRVFNEVTRYIVPEAAASVPF